MIIVGLGKSEMSYWLRITRADWEKDYPFQYVDDHLWISQLGMTDQVRMTD